MSSCTTKDGPIPYTGNGKKAQALWKTKTEPVEFDLSELLVFLCSPHRMGRYRQHSLENDVEYLRWFLERRTH